MAYLADRVVLMKGLPPAVNEGKIIAFFADFNGIYAESATIGEDSVTREQDGTAYCVFDSVSDAREALGANGEEVLGKKVEVLKIPKESLVVPKTGMYSAQIFDLGKELAEIKKRLDALEKGQGHPPPNLIPLACRGGI